MAVMQRRVVTLQASKMLLKIQVGNYVIRQQATKWDGEWWGVVGKANFGKALALGWTDIKVTVFVEIEGEAYEILIGNYTGKRKIRFGGYYVVKPGVDLEVGQNSFIRVVYNASSGTDWLIVKFAARVVLALPELQVMTVETVTDDDIFVMQTEQTQTQTTQRKRKKRKKQVVEASSEQFDEFSD